MAFGKRKSYTLCISLDNRVEQIGISPYRIHLKREILRVLTLQNVPCPRFYAVSGACCGFLETTGLIIGEYYLCYATLHDNNVCLEIHDSLFIVFFF